MALVLQPYEHPPAVCNDLPLTETLKDALYALETLSCTIDDIFGRLEKKITNERGRLSSISNRITASHKKVDALRGSKNATTVFSTAKFPASKSMLLYPTLYDEESIPNMPNPYRSVDDDLQYVCADPKKSSIANEELTSELQALLSRLNSYGTDIERVEFIMEDKGLGSLPLVIPSVGSLLLFNSSINPYKSYQTLDNLFTTGRSKARDAEDGVVTKTPLASAPISLLSRDTLPDLNGLDLTFKPSLGEVSALALPANLPLDFVAVDIHYTGMALPSIAPSSFSAIKPYGPPMLPPAFVADPSAVPPPPLPSSMPSLPVNLPSVSSQQPTNSQLPPPPPPPPTAPTVGITSMSLPSPAAAAAVALQLPPQTVPIVPTSYETVTAVVAPQEPSSGSALDDAEPDQPRATGRSSLLDAIKGMGIDKLRKKEEDNVAAAKQQRVEAGGGGGGKSSKPTPMSMMDQMKERMRQRNSALTGKLDKEKQKRDSEIVQAQRDSMMMINTSSNSNIYAASGIPPPPNLPSAPSSSSAPPPPPPPPMSVPSQSMAAASATTIAKALNRNANKKRFDDSDSSDGSDDTSSVVTDITVMTSYGDEGGGGGGGGAGGLRGFNRGPPAPLPPKLNSNSNPSLSALLSSRAPTFQPPVTSPPPPPMLSNPMGDNAAAVAPSSGNGLLDASKNSAISQMLKAAKQKQKGSDSDDDDEWD